MIVLIHPRSNLTVREIKTRLALKASNEEIQAQNEEIQSQAEEILGINENLEQLVKQRTQELEKKNKALEEYLTSHDYKLYRVRDEKLEPYTASTEDREFNVLAL